MHASFWSEDYERAETRADWSWRATTAHAHQRRVFFVCVCRDVLAAAALPLRFCPYVPPFVRRFFSILPSDRSESACSVQRAAFYFFASCGPQPVFLSEYLNALGSRPNLDRYKSAYKVN